MWVSYRVISLHSFVYPYQRYAMSIYFIYYHSAPINIRLLKMLPNQCQELRLGLFQRLEGIGRTQDPE